MDQILGVDVWILDAIAEVRQENFDPAIERITSWSDLARTRAETDARIAALSQRSDALFGEALPVWSDRLGRERRIPRGLYVMQLFNHQTHHRAQVTAALHRLGIDYGVTDLPARPGSPW